MTQAEFLKRFARKVKRERSKWHLLDYVCLRGPRGCCPLTYVSGTRGIEVDAAVNKLGISYENAWKIAEAADSAGFGAPSRLSRKLLKAAGVGNH